MKKYRFYNIDRDASEIKKLLAEEQEKFEHLKRSIEDLERELSIDYGPDHDYYYLYDQHLTLKTSL